MEHKLGVTALPELCHLEEKDYGFFMPILAFHSKSNIPIEQVTINIRDCYFKMLLDAMTENIDDYIYEINRIFKESIGHKYEDMFLYSMETFHCTDHNTARSHIDRRIEDVALRKETWKEIKSFLQEVPKQVKIDERFFACSHMKNPVLASEFEKFTPKTFSGDIRTFIINLHETILIFDFIYTGKSRMDICCPLDYMYEAFAEFLIKISAGKGGEVF